MTVVVPPPYPLFIDDNDRLCSGTVLSLGRRGAASPKEDSYKRENKSKTESINKRGEIDVTKE